MESFKSIWGDGEGVTLKAIGSLEPGGRWLNLAAGDGRYVQQLVDKVDSLVLADINLDEAKRIFGYLTDEQREKVEFVEADLTKTLPFPDIAFDGVFCTGALHMFSADVLKDVMREIDRILKPRGKLILDLATEATKRYNDGRVEIGYEGMNYTTLEAKRLLGNLLVGYAAQFTISSFTDDVSDLKDYGYTQIGDFILAVATKLS